MKTKAIRLYGEKDLRFEEFDLRDITEGEILIKVICDSICMSTYKTAMQGSKHLRVPNDIATNPIIVGHEFCAQIVKVGKRWQNKYSVGEKIIIPPALDYCAPNTIGYSFGEIGGDATYAIVYEHIIERGYLLEFQGDAYFKGSIIEPVSCIVRGYKGTFHLKGDDHITGLKSGGRLAILGGCGPMGLEAIDIAISCENKPMILVVADIDKDRLARAERLFAEKAKSNGVELFFTTETDKETLMKYTDGKGYDDVFVYAPVSSLIETADSILAFDGCLNFFAGPIDKSLSAKFNFYNVHYLQHHVAGTSGSTTEDIKESSEMVGKGVIDPAVMISHIGGLNAVIDTTLNLPNIPGGKKLIYTHIDLPLTALSDFEKLGKSDKRFAVLDELVKENNGVWSAAAEKYLLENFI